MILLDTNILTRMSRRGTPQGGLARSSIQKLSTRDQLVIVPQNLYESWAVATRAPGPPPIGSNGLGMSAVSAGQWLRFFQRRFQLLPDLEDLPVLWLALVEKHGVTGYKCHDARLAAAMQSHGIPRFLTFNTADFRKFPITCIDPATV